MPHVYLFFALTESSRLAAFCIFNHSTRYYNFLRIFNKKQSMNYRK